MATQINLPGLLQMMFKDYEESRTAKQARYTEGKGILENIVNMFGPGYLKGEEKKMLAEMEQGMVGRGLGGTTRPAAAGMGIKADIRGREMRGRAGAMTNVAQYMAGFQDLAPTPGTLAHLATGGFSGMLEQQKLAFAEQEAGRGYDPFGRPIAPAGGGGGAGAGGAGGRAGGGTTAGGGWTPGGLPTTTGAGAATYGIGGGITSPAGSPQALWEQGPEVWGASLEAERARAGPEGLYGTQYEWAGQGPEAGPVKEPTISEFLQQHGLDPTSTDPASMGKARTLQQQWASMYR